MEYVSLQGTSLKVSRIGLGTWSIGGWMWGGTDETQAIRTIHQAIDEGITLIDTAPVYGFGIAETIVGKALAQSSKREKVLLATKFGLEEYRGKVYRNTSRERILIELNDSLRRLQTDYIDIYQVHWPDPHVAPAETASALKELLAQGKIRAIGVSNYAPDQMQAFAQHAPIHCAQPPYNLFERDIEKDVLPYCREHGIATLLYGSLCRGLLSGRMQRDTHFEGDDLRKWDPKFRPPRYEPYLEAVRQLSRIAEQKYHRSMLQLAVRWVLDQPGATVALWGARRPEQLAPVKGVDGWKLDEETLREIDQILHKTILAPVGPEFMAPPARKL